MAHPTLSTFDQAMSLLSYREHASKELFTKLKTRGHAEEDISDVIERLTAMNYLNDARFAEIFVRSKINRSLGAYRILQELSQKGITSEIAKQAISNADIDWFELAKQTRERKFGEEVSRDLKDKAKQSRYLQYRGFDFEQIKYAMESSQ